jgi:hypothetical protein
MKEQIRWYKDKYKIYLTPLDQSYADENVWSYEGRVFDLMNNCIIFHHFNIDDVYYGRYTMDYMFKRLENEIDKLEGL